MKESLLMGNDENEGDQHVKNVEIQIQKAIKDIAQGNKNRRYEMNSIPVENSLSRIERIVFDIFNKALPLSFFLFLVCLLVSLSFDKYTLFWRLFFVISTSFTGLFCFIYLLSSCYVVNQREATVFMAFGKILSIKKDPGCGVYWPLFVQRISLNMNLQTIEIKGKSICDLNGSPLNVSCIVTFMIKEAEKALFNVKSYSNFLHTQALEVLRRVVAKFPYRSDDLKMPTLLQDTIVIGKVMKEVLQEKVAIAGICVLEMELMELSYHVEVAQGLLQVQQAQAKLEARRIIVEGSVGILQDTLDQLKTKGIKLSEDGLEKIVKSLLVVLCSENSSPQPVIHV